MVLGILENIKNKPSKNRYPVGKVPEVCFLKESFLYRGNVCLKLVRTPFSGR